MYDVGLTVFLIRRLSVNTEGFCGEGPNFAFCEFTKEKKSSKERRKRKLFRLRGHRLGNDARTWRMRILVGLLCSVWSLIRTGRASIALAWTRIVRSFLWIVTGQTTFLSSFLFLFCFQHSSLFKGFCDSFCSFLLFSLGYLHAFCNYFDFPSLFFLISFYFIFPFSYYIMFITFFLFLISFCLSVFNFILMFFLFYFVHLIFYLHLLFLSFFLSYFILAFFLYKFLIFFLFFSSFLIKYLYFIIHIQYFLLFHSFIYHISFFR